MTRGVRRTFVLFVALALGLVSAAAAHAAAYTFTNVADSVRDDFNPNSFACSSLNNRGEVAFKAGRTSPDGLNSFDGIYRAGEVGNNAVPGSVEDPTTIGGDQPVYDRSGGGEMLQRADFVGFHQPGVAGNVGR